MHLGPPQTGAYVQARKQMWTLLGFPPALLGLVAEELQKVEELKVCARILLGLGRMYLERGHHDCVGTTAALMHAERARRACALSLRAQQAC